MRPWGGRSSELSFGLQSSVERTNTPTREHKQARQGAPATSRSAHRGSLGSIVRHHRAPRPIPSRISMCWWVQLKLLLLAKRSPLAFAALALLALLALTPPLLACKVLLLLLSGERRTPLLEAAVPCQRH